MREAPLAELIEQGYEAVKRELERNQRQHEVLVSTVRALEGVLREGAFSPPEDVPAGWEIWEKGEGA
jgi:hypothetical protein